MKFLLLCVLLVFPAVAQSPKNNPVAKKDECSIAGTVVKLAGSEPLRKARVLLTSAEDRARNVSISTDSDGRFQLKGLQPGRYRLAVSRHGFVSQYYGQRKPNDPGAILTLHPGQDLKDLLFRLIPSGVIAGKIVDEDGEPLPFVVVSASRQTFSEGKRTLAPAASAQTNDLGEYRLFDLTPGRYFVSAVYPRWNRRMGGPESEDLDVGSEGYAKLYYPGSPDSAKASSIPVKSGEEISSINIFLRPVHVYRLRGRVFNQITSKPENQIDIMLFPKGKTFDWTEHQAVVQKKDGSFEIPDVLPGSYVLTAFWFDEGKGYTQRLPLEVGNADVNGITVTIAPGVSVPGRILWDGPPATDKDELTVAATPVDVDFNYMGATRVEQGAFTMKDIGNGTYYAEVNGLSQDCYVKDVRYAGNDALDDGFTVNGGAVGELEITVSSRGARVDGAVTDEDGLPLAGVWVVLVPETQRENRHLYKMQTTDQYGHFALRGVRPGAYKVFSWQEVETNAWESPEFLKPFEDKGEKVELQQGGQKTIKLTAIPSKPAEPAN